jgi:hypothetical protein
MGEADDRYLADIGKDCEGMLGAGIALLGVEREDGDEGVRLVARYQLEDRVWESAAVGETVVAAHAALRDRLLIDRLRLGFTVLTERGLL